MMANYKADAQATILNLQKQLQIAQGPRLEHLPDLLDKTSLQPRNLTTFQPTLPSLDMAQTLTVPRRERTGARHLKASPAKPLEQMRSHLVLGDADFEIVRIEEKVRRHDVMAHVHAFGMAAVAGIIHHGVSVWWVFVFLFEIFLDTLKSALYCCSLSICEIWLYSVEYNTRQMTVTNSEFSKGDELLRY